MTDPTPSVPAYTAFLGTTCFAHGSLATVAARVKEALEADPSVGLLVFDDRNGRLVDLDLRGSLADVLARLPVEPEPAEGPDAPVAAPAAVRSGPGRPRLGVVSREVTLLPRHWEWLARQPGGASVTLRKLVEQARQQGSGRDRQREARESAYRYMQAMAGDLVGFEEATRALFAGDRDGFALQTRTWPVDVREYARRLAGAAFEPLHT